MKKSLLDAIQRIKDAGFTHLKVELEAHIGRGDEAYCDDCDGNGYMECEECNGEGVTSEYERIGIENREVWAECDTCVGEGSYSCERCEGEGYRYRLNEDEDCKDFIFNEVSQEAREALNFSKFYEDGSVDSEFTFTLPIEKCEYVLEYINAFKALADECNGLDTEGAGMHISVLRSSHYCSNYGCDRCGSLEGNRLRNFTNQMNKLLPALFFLASANSDSRELGYRFPRISNDDKYSAIYTVGGRCFEFRVFETCYYNPEAFLDFVEVIANCLKFYANPNLTVEELGREFGFKYGYGTSRFFDTPEQLQILSAQVKHLKPKGKSFKKLKQERGMPFTIKSLKAKEREKIMELRKEYEKYLANRSNLISQPLTDQQKSEVEWLTVNQDYTYNRAVQQVKNIPSIKSFRSFIRDNLMNRDNFEVMVSV